MGDQFINLTELNIENEHLCCIIRTKKPHLGVEMKRNWLKDRLKEGHTFRKLDVKGTVFIEYAPLESAWVPIEGNHYYYIYCLWVLGEFRGKGYAKRLLDYCIEDAKRNNKSGICMLGAKKQKSWLSNQEFMKKYGFKVVDETENDYQLLALSFDDTTSKFIENAKKGIIENKQLTIYYDKQCPYIYSTIEKIKDYCMQQSIPSSFIEVETLKQAKELPCVFNNWAVFYKGQFVTVNLLSVDQIKKIILK